MTNRTLSKLLVFNMLIQACMSWSVYSPIWLFYSIQCQFQKQQCTIKNKKHLGALGWTCLIFSCVSRQVVLQPPVQPRGHAGDHEALCRVPRWCPWAAWGCLHSLHWVSDQCQPQLAAWICALQGGYWVEDSVMGSSLSVLKDEVALNQMYYFRFTARKGRVRLVWINPLN